MSKINKIKTEYFCNLAEIEPYSVEFYYTKRSKNEPVKIEEGALNQKFTKYELLLAVIMRLGSRWLPSEVKYLEEKCKVPVLMQNEDGVDGRYRSISQVQNLIKQWRNQDVTGITKSELESLGNLTNILKDGGSSDEINDLGFENVSLNLAENYISSLPTLAGCMMRKDNTKYGVVCTIDTGASSSACGRGLMEELGFTEEDLTRCPNVKINTANSPCKLLGILKAKIFLKWKRSRFYYINVEIFVLDSPLKRLLIGMNALNKADYVMSTKTITLDCFEIGEKTRRRVFELNLGGRSSREDWVELAELRNGSQIFNCKSDYNPVMRGKGFRLIVEKRKSNNKTLDNVSFPLPEDAELGKVNCKIEEGNGQILNVVFEYEIDSKLNLGNNWRNSIYSIEYQSKSMEEEIKEDMDEALEDFELMVAEAAKADGSKTYEELLEHMEEAGDVENDLLDKISLFPDLKQDDQKEEYWLPNMDSLEPEWKDKFVNLFSKHKENFSKDKWDICISTLPEVSLPTKGDKVACLPCRRYMEDELRIIDTYLEELERKGLIRKLNHQEYSPWNHNIHLVYRQAGDVKKYCTAQADKISHEERINLLRESARAVADVRGLNDLIESHGTMHLPKISEVLPYLGGKIVCLTDIRSGFSTIALDYESKLKSAFTHRNTRYVWNVLLQGAKIAPLLYAHRMELVFNVDSFEHYKESFAPNEGLDYHKMIIRYLDDILLVADTVKQTYFLWEYIMWRLALFKIKITRAKTSFMESSFSFLGWRISPAKGTYGLETQRKAAILNWEFNPTRTYIVSRLATLNWNSNLILGFKVLSQLLSILVQSDNFEVKKIHVREWNMILFASSLALEIYLPDLNKNIYLTTDSSFSALGGFLFQYVPAKGYKHEGICWENDSSEIINEENNKNKVEKEFQSTLEVISMFSRRWSRGDIAKSIVYKEVLALLACLHEYQTLLRSCRGHTVIFTDAICLSFIHRLKNVNSRIYSVALILSSFERIKIFFTKGGYLTFVSDILSRSLEGCELEGETGLDPKLLEKLPRQFVDNVCISAETVHKICLMPLAPHYSACVSRRKQTFERVLSEEKMLQLIETGRLPEQDLMDAVCLGYDFVKPDSVIFQKPKEKNLISKGEYNKLAQKLKFDEIRSYVMFLEEHSYHGEDPEQMAQYCEQFMRNLRKYMRDSTTTKDQKLWDRLNEILASPAWSAREFYEILELLHKSPIYNTEERFDDLKPCLFIPTFLGRGAEIKLEYSSGYLLIRAKYEKIIQEGDPVVYSVQLEFLTKYLFDIINTKSDGLFYPVMKENGIRKNILYLVYGCQSTKEVKIEKNEIIAKILFHFPINSKCNCVSPERIYFVVQNETQLADEENVIILMAELLKLNMSRGKCEKCGELWCECGDTNVGDCYQLEAPAVSAEHQQWPEEGDGVPEKQHTKPYSRLNQLLALCLSYNRKNIFAPEIIAQLQCSSEFLREIREKVKEHKIKEYFLYKNCLFKNTSRGSRLCLDGSTAKLIILSLHKNGYHHSKELFLEHFNRYFSCKDIKLIVSDSIKECGVCIFGQNCKRENFVKNYSKETAPRVFETVHVDIAEKFCTSEEGYSSCVILTDRASNRVVARALKKIDSESICQFIKDVIMYLGAPETLISDFGAPFRSGKFREILDKYKIHHERSCSRSCSNGLSEQSVKLLRSKLKDLILTSPAEKRAHWQDHLEEACLIVNSQPPIYKINGLTRDQLFFGRQKFINSLFYNIPLSGHLDIGDQDQQQALRLLHEYRLNYRKKFKDKINPYCLGQLVTRPLDKSEHIDDDNTGKLLKSNVTTIYKVIGLNENSCRLENLIDSSKISIDWGKLKPLTESEVKLVFDNYSFIEKTHLSSFNSNLYQPGRGKSVLETVNDLNLNKFLNSERCNEEGSQEMDEQMPLEAVPPPASNEKLPEGDMYPETDWEKEYELCPYAHMPIRRLDKAQGPETRPMRGPGVEPMENVKINQKKVKLNKSRAELLAKHPKPDKLIDSWGEESGGEVKLIPRQSNRNDRYPSRERKSRKLYQANAAMMALFECTNVKTKPINGWVNFLGLNPILKRGRRNGHNNKNQNVKFNTSIHTRKIIESESGEILEIKDQDHKCTHPCRGYDFWNRRIRLERTTSPHCFYVLDRAQAKRGL